MSSSHNNPVGYMGTPTEKRTLFHFLAPIFLTVITYLGIRVIWPRDQIEGIAAQQVEMKLEHTNLVGRYEAHVVYEANERITMKADIRRLLILQCSTINRADRAYTLADCNVVLGR